jgi:hypothetical protein
MSKTQRVVMVEPLSFPSGRTGGFGRHALTMSPDRPLYICYEKDTGLKPSPLPVTSQQRPKGFPSCPRVHVT